jgi:hypothetical protein
MGEVEIESGNESRLVPRKKTRDLEVLPRSFFRTLVVFSPVASMQPSTYRCGISLGTYCMGPPGSACLQRPSTSFIECSG